MRLEHVAAMAGLAVASMLGFIAPVRAATITYIDSGLLSGTFNGFGFTNDLVTITYVGDAANTVEYAPGFYVNFAGSTAQGTITVQGVGSGTFLGAESFVNPTGNSYIAGVGAGGTAGSSGGVDTISESLAGYALGPTGATGGFDVTNGYSVFVTTAGDRIVFSNNGEDTTFSATLSSVPLPASAPMFGAAVLGLAGLGYGMKRKKVVAAA